MVGIFGLKLEGLYPSHQELTTKAGQKWQQQARKHINEKISESKKAFPLKDVHIVLNIFDHSPKKKIHDIDERVQNFLRLLAQTGYISDAKHVHNIRIDRFFAPAFTHTHAFFIPEELYHE